MTDNSATRQVEHQDPAQPMPLQAQEQILEPRPLRTLEPMETLATAGDQIEPFCKLGALRAVPEAKGESSPVCNKHESVPQRIWRLLSSMTTQSPASVSSFRSSAHSEMGSRYGGRYRVTEEFELPQLASRQSTASTSAFEARHSTTSTGALEASERSGGANS